MKASSAAYARCPGLSGRASQLPILRAIGWCAAPAVRVRRAAQPPPRACSMCRATLLRTPAHA
jgi:hypothetical protein